MDRNLALEFVRVTEAAAIAAAKWVGKGDAKKADAAAVDEMRDRFNQIDFAGTVVIGEGSKDESAELYNGEKVGRYRAPSPRLRQGFGGQAVRALLSTLIQRRRKSFPGFQCRGFWLFPK